MGDLVKRLQRHDEYEPLGNDGWEAADRIEQLERELAHQNRLMQDAHDGWKIARDDLAAEKALADRLYPWVQKYAPAGANIGADEDIAAYRKARGL